MNLLIVDDTPTDLKLLRAQLEAEGHAVFEAHDGVDALALLKRQRVGAVISDILMPRMDGYRLCHEIRKHARLHDLPVILYTATYTSPDDEKLALDMGADKYLKKPTSFETLVTALHEVTVMPHAAPQPKALQEGEVLKEYSERLVSKLQEKNTELHAQAEALRASDEHYRSMTRSANDAIITADAAGRICNWNRGAEHIFGYGENEVHGQPLEMIIPPQYRDRHRGGMQRVQAGGEANIIGKTVELAGLHRDGREFPLELSLSQWETSGGRFFTAIIRDITERKRAEKEILSVARFPAENPSPVLRVAHDGRLLYANRSSQRLLEHWHCAQAGQSLPEADCGWIAETLERGGIQYQEVTCGEVIYWLELTPIPEMGYVNIYGRDITERKQAEQTLRASEERYRTLAETAQDIIYVIDREFRMTYINEYGARHFGRSLPEMIGRHLTELLPAETTQWQLADLAGVFRTGESLYHERQLSTGQRLMWLDSRLVPIKNATGEVESILGISRDITEHKQVEGQRLRTQRLESIGTLAGGVAHDLNNALAPILLAAELLRLEFPNMAGTYLDLIQASAQRGAAMVKQLLTFAKGVEGERLLIQPKHLLKEMEKLIGSTFPKNIQLKTRYGKDLRTILGDVTQLHQVLLNLCINARDAMPEGGTLTLEAENMELETVYADALMEAKPGHYVVWRIMDTGTGIPPEILDRIFDPFFTTKGPGKGTGLGLSTLIGIVKSHGGFVRVYSVPGKGSTFVVYLPAAASGADDTPLPTETDMAFRGHGETILVVDDEDAVRNVLRAILTKLNFKVLTASDGTAALTQVTEQSAELRAVITDVHMSHMDGLSFVRVLKGRLPQVGIIVASGRLDEPDENEFKKLGVSAVLDKPFSQKELVKALKTVFQK